MATPATSLCHSVQFILSGRKSIRMEADQGKHRDHFPSGSLVFSTFKSLQFSILNRYHIQMNLSFAPCKVSLTKTLILSSKYCNLIVEEK